MVIDDEEDNKSYCYSQFLNIPKLDVDFGVDAEDAALLRIAEAQPIADSATLALLTKAIEQAQGNLASSVAQK